MRFETDDLIEILRLSEQENLSSRQIAEIYNCSKSTINYFLAHETYLDFWETHDPENPIASGVIIDPVTNRDCISTISNKKVFIFTSAQNNTHIHNNFWLSLQQCAKHRNAEIIIGSFKYNLGGFQHANNDEIWYDPKIRDYIVDKPLTLTEGLVWCGELNILPTAVNPISGLNNYTGGDSCIFPHAKVQLESVPTAKFKETKIIYTTGCITQSNYIQMKAGQKGAHHHIYGALIVEIDDDGTWFARQIIADSENGEFYDLDHYYEPTLVRKSETVLGINWGDIHVEKLDSEVANISFGVKMDGEDSLPYKSNNVNMLDDLKPKYSIYNDIIDFKVRNHHNRNNPLFKIKMNNDKTEEVDFGLKQCGALLQHCSRDFTQQVVVNSNHDAALEKWAVECSWVNDPVNAEFLLKCQLELVKNVKMKNDNFCVFEYMTKILTPNIDDVKFLALDESFVLGGDGGIECGYHGHTGNNGARGSTQGYRIAGSRYNIGHQHSSSIKDGVYVAGVTGKLDLDYNIGMSSWSNSHIVTYDNLKRAIITVKKGRYRGNYEK